MQKHYVRVIEMDETAREILGRRKEEIESEMNRMKSQIAFQKDQLKRKEAMLLDITEALGKIEGISRDSSPLDAVKINGGEEYVIWTELQRKRDLAEDLSRQVRC